MRRFLTLAILIIGLGLSSCEKLVEIEGPVDALTTENIFKTEARAEAALMGIYSSMIHGHESSQGGNITASSSFSSGLTTIEGAISSDESGGEYLQIPTTREIKAGIYWESAYKTIFLANSFMEGLERYAGKKIRDSTKSVYTAESKVLRAFTYMNLVNLFGNVPLVLTSDIHKTKSLPRAPKDKVVGQIILDLTEAFQILPDDFSNGDGERIRVTKWAAAALLARVHLYNKEYTLAEKYASDVLANVDNFSLESLERTFLKDSREIIFQLKPSNKNIGLGNLIPEARDLIPNPRNLGVAYYYLSDELLHSFEPGDRRPLIWLDSTTQSNANDPLLRTKWFPIKYTLGTGQRTVGGIQPQYYVVLRLAEMYLIRSEARLFGGPGGLAGAIDDLNMLRSRASLVDLPNELTSSEIFDAVMEERRHELFFEWGHRWFDLIRTKKAKEVLSQSQKYQIWPGDWIFLYPIPRKEIQNNPSLVQNPEYDVLLNTAFN